MNDSKREISTKYTVVNVEKEQEANLLPPKYSSADTLLQSPICEKNEIFPAFTVQVLEAGLWAPFSCFQSYRIGKKLGQTYPCRRYILTSLLLSGLFIGTIIFFDDLLFFLSSYNIVGLIMLILFFCLLFAVVYIRFMMILILRRKYVEHAKLNETLFRSMLIMTCCNPCAYGEMSIYTKSLEKFETI